VRRKIPSLSHLFPPTKRQNPSCLTDSRNDTEDPLAWPPSTLKRSGRTLGVHLFPAARGNILSLAPPILHRNGMADPSAIINQTFFQPAASPEGQASRIFRPHDAHPDRPREDPAAASLEGPVRRIFSPRDPRIASPPPTMANFRKIIKGQT